MRLEANPTRLHAQQQQSELRTFFFSFLFFSFSSIFVHFHINLWESDPTNATLAEQRGEMKQLNCHIPKIIN
jgi:hypothetical protein